MEEALSNSPANGAIRLPDDPEDHPVKTKTARLLQSHKFHNFILALIVVDCIIVVAELCWKLLDDSCTRGGVEHPPEWLEWLLYVSMVISVIFVLELPPTLWVFGFEYYNPWSDVPHSTFHLFDAFIILMNFTIIFLQGPAQEIVGLLVILRLWRLIKLLGGVATGVEGLNRELTYRLESRENELKQKTAELDECKQKLDELQRKLDASQP
ncbi:SubName: Full=Uncharacterized protein {ECO:0000313/EMBL:CCA68166.1} [Serendipita indica DSM 11827]|uniref:Voltage-gated hydrogen channel 1 n=1 Tax=Serendipita indica (strain DSM 11827) TaxID=1109443 RepID=G4TA46_SERID|nr:SubName: Full=Uncharacterized protein {ECO:0000313/EMBL:CCA68166.1} [Serendipita indica DSM 11827]CCA68166.1 hypothetical protein PIIN_02032 [Serendipita indica DSM 11827]